jgi:hypothetical protein
MMGSLLCFLRNLEVLGLKEPGSLPNVAAIFSFIACFNLRINFATFLSFCKIQETSKMRLRNCEREKDNARSFLSFCTTQETSNMMMRNRDREKFNVRPFLSFCKTQETSNMMMRNREKEREKDNQC